MNIVFVEGGNKLLREIAHKTVAFCIDELIPESNKLEIEVKLKSVGGDAMGYCEMGDTRRQYQLEIEKNQTLRELISTICHEMVHLKQYYTKEMDCSPNDEGKMRWKDGVVPEGTSYSDLPWEIEASDLQYKLADAIWEKNII
jgi:hypothetical protein